MENYLVNEIKKYISPALIKSLGVTANETKASIENAFDVAIPSLLIKVKLKGDAYLRGMFSEVKNIFATGQDDFIFKIDKTESVLNGLLGDQRNRFVTEVSLATNITQTSSLTILKTSFIGIIDYFKNLDSNFDFSTFNRVLDDNIDALKILIPSGLGLQSNKNLPSSQPTNNSVDTVVKRASSQIKSDKSLAQDLANTKSRKSLKYTLITLFLALCALFFFYHKCSREVSVERIVNNLSQFDFSNTNNVKHFLDALILT